MSFAPTPNQSGLQVALRAFLLSVLPSGVSVVEGQDNRVPEPVGSDFVVMTTIRRERIETNVDTFGDVKFTGAISGTTLTVTGVTFGQLAIGNTVWGANIAAGTTITAFGSGTGGVGTYTISPSQTVASQIMAAGVTNITQPTKVTVQLDFHSADVGDSSDMAQTVSTLFRDDYAVNFFVANGYANITPLHADDPRQVPFINAEQAYETRWIVDATLQVNQLLTPPQQYMDEVDVTFIPVDIEFPAA
jgi:hypothetical protein